MREIVEEWYLTFKEETRTVKGELVVKGFDSHEQYESFYMSVLEDLAPFFEGDYSKWYRNWLVSYIRYRKSTNRTDDFYCPQRDTGYQYHTVREQLAVIRYFLYRRATSKYKSKIEQ